MRIIYQLSVYLYYTGILISSPFHAKARKWLQGRRNWYVRLQQEMKSNTKPVIWIHCSSLGEFEQGRPVIEAIRHTHPNVFLLLTFYSSSGFEIRKNYSGVNLVTYLPLDSKKNARKWLGMVNPCVAVFVKYEFWYHFIHNAYQNQVQLFLISAIFRPSQVFFRWYGAWYRNVLNYFSHIFTQDEDSASLLRRYGLTKITVSGDTRFDRVITLAVAEKSIPEARIFVDGHLVIIAGSTWEPDEKLLLRYLSETTYPLKLILVPHEIHAPHIARLRESFPGQAICFTEAAGQEQKLKKARMLVVDTIGLLGTLYRYAAIAYIGGGFGKGIHNVLEAAVYGMPVLFGPNYEKFREAREMVSLGCGIPVSGYNVLKNQLDTLIANPDMRQKLSEQAATFVRERTGATRSILQAIHPFIAENEQHYTDIHPG